MLWISRKCGPRETGMTPSPQAYKSPPFLNLSLRIFIPYPLFSTVALRTLVTTPRRRKFERLERGSVQYASRSFPIRSRWLVVICFVNTVSTSGWSANGHVPCAGRKFKLLTYQRTCVMRTRLPPYLWLFDWSVVDEQVLFYCFEMNYSMPSIHPKSYVLLVIREQT